MWSDNRSLILSKCCVIAFMVMLVVFAVLAPMADVFLLHYMTRLHRILFLVTVYTGAVPAAMLLILLLSLLSRIGKGEVFVRENTECLRRISWCCFAGALICAASSAYWIPWFVVGTAAGFVGLIVRVIKNVIAKAIELQDDVNHTI